MKYILAKNQRISHMLDKLRCWLSRKSLGVITKIDYTMKRGDSVVWKSTDMTVEIVDVNWALLAVAVRLSPKSHVVIVLPAWSLRQS